MRILGLDPGSQRTGYGCVAPGPDGPTRIASGVIRLGKGPLPERLARLHTELGRLFAVYSPDACAIEGVFHQRNVRSALILGHARGVCMLAAAVHAVPVAEYAPARVKLSIVGHGAADKSRVSAMVASILGFEPHDSFDETDALALALCHLEAQRPLRLVE